MLCSPQRAEAHAPQPAVTIGARSRSQQRQAIYVMRFADIFAWGTQHTSFDLVEAQDLSSEIPFAAAKTSAWDRRHGGHGRTRKAPSDSGP